MSWLLLLVPTVWVMLGLRVHQVATRPTRWPSRVLPAVVLGARVFDDGTPSAALVGRVEAGVQLLREGKTTRLVLTGGSISGRPTEASVMARIAEAAGAPRDSLLLEDQSRSTFENAARTAELLEAREILLVTCDFHLARASAYFRDRGFTVWPVPSRRPLRAADRLMVTAREVVGFFRRPRLLARL